MKDVSSTDRSIEVPKDVSVVGFDDIPMAQMSAPSLTTVAMPSERAGRLAVDVLSGRIGDRLREQDAAARHALPTSLIVRSSTAPPPRATRRRSE